MKTWKEIIIQAFINLGEVAKYKALNDEFLKIAPLGRAQNNKTWEVTIRRGIKSCPSDSFNKK